MYAKKNNRINVIIFAERKVIIFYSLPDVLHNLKV